MGAVFYVKRENWFSLQETRVFNIFSFYVYTYVFFIFIYFLDRKHSNFEKTKRACFRLPKQRSVALKMKNILFEV